MAIKISDLTKPDIHIPYARYVDNNLVAWLNEHIGTTTWDHNFFAGFGDGKPHESTYHDTLHDLYDGIFFEREEDKIIFALCWGHICTKK